MPNYFVTGIDTNSGKTLVSAILCMALDADYWKPIQAGFPRDTDTIKALTTGHHVYCHEEAYLLQSAMSPHAAARIDGVTIRKDHINLPTIQKNLVIEGAGGCLVPLNDQDFIIDLVPQLNAEIVLVADLYLGSINHTLLTLNLLIARNYAVKGIIFNGPPNSESQRIILRHSPYRQLLHITPEPNLDPGTLAKYVEEIKTNWNI